MLNSRWLRVLLRTQPNHPLQIWKYLTEIENIRIYERQIIRVLLELSRWFYVRLYKKNLGWNDLKLEQKGFSEFCALY